MWYDITIATLYLTIAIAGLALGLSLGSLLVARYMTKDISEEDDR